MPVIHLPERTLIAANGDDARDFLERLITNDVETMDKTLVVPSALLTPQGKIMFDFLICETEAGFLIDIRRDIADDFLRRMSMYRLRAKVTLEADDRPIHAVWGKYSAVRGLRDSRFPTDAGVERFYGPADNASSDIAEWNNLRIAHGVAESGSDYDLSDAFPHDLLMDLNGGISFSKGCFVGQEVVSRMKHRNTARKRVAILTAETPLPAQGTGIEAGGRPLGTLGTVVGNQAMAIVRIDRVADAVAANQAITAGGAVLTVALPAWTGLTLPQSGSGD